MYVLYVIEECDYWDDVVKGIFCYVLMWICWKCVVQENYGEELFINDIL